MPAIARSLSALVSAFEVSRDRFCNIAGVLVGGTVAALVLVGCGQELSQRELDECRAALDEELARAQRDVTLCNPSSELPELKFLRGLPDELADIRERYLAAELEGAASSLSVYGYGFQSVARVEQWLEQEANRLSLVELLSQLSKSEGAECVLGEAVFGEHVHWRILTLMTASSLRALVEQGEMETYLRTVEGTLRVGSFAANSSDAALHGWGVSILALRWLAAPTELAVIEFGPSFAGRLSELLLISTPMASFRDPAKKVRCIQDLTRFWSTMSPKTISVMKALDYAIEVAEECDAHAAAIDGLSYLHPKRSAVDDVLTTRVLSHAASEHRYITSGYASNRAFIYALDQISDRGGAAASRTFNQVSVEVRSDAGVTVRDLDLDELWLTLRHQVEDR